MYVGNIEFKLISAKGVASREVAGHIANIAESASRLNPNMPSPVVSIEGENGYVLIIACCLPSQDHFIREMIPKNFNKPCISGFCVTAWH